jgi:hypothetical protein
LEPTQQQLLVLVVVLAMIQPPLLAVVLMMSELRLKCRARQVLQRLLQHPLLRQVQQATSSSTERPLLVTLLLLLLLLRSGGLLLLLRCELAVCLWAACWAQAAWLRRSGPWQQQGHSCWQHWGACCEQRQRQQLWQGGVEVWLLLVWRCAFVVGHSKGSSFSSLSFK